MGRILLTGFGPFDRWAVNSSWEAVRRVAGRHRGIHRGIEAAWLPVEHAGAAERVNALVGTLAPEAVLLCGLTPGPVPRLERVGRAGPLAAGDAQGRDTSLRHGRWPWAAAHDRAAARALPLGRSTDAGGYVCDSTYWAALGTAAPLVAFLHLPPVGDAWPPARAAALVEAVLEAAGAPEIRPSGSGQSATA